ncbi:hypothetical protein mRhiFer1_010095 [Rhinolophus ferrumequinum]|uniref:Uncharacterized protein n=1 Tax=Rhinolophus ferrumequinum TaxID=59479 RepID=A0A7J7XPM0_RHIFE|nr:hypothetical protein mRhiFer1_010095 [Rhinolophus ferrumequinum]
MYRVSRKIGPGLVLRFAPKDALGHMFRECHPENYARAYFPVRSYFGGNTVYVCVLYLHVCVMCTCTCTFVCIYIFVCAYLYLCICLCICVCVKGNLVMAQSFQQLYFIQIKYFTFITSQHVCRPHSP